MDEQIEYDGKRVLALGSDEEFGNRNRINDTVRRSADRHSSACARGCLPDLGVHAGQREAPLRMRSDMRAASPAATAAGHVALAAAGNSGTWQCSPTWCIAASLDSAASVSAIQCAISCA